MKYNVKTLWNGRTLENNKCVQCNGLSDCTASTTNVGTTITTAQLRSGTAMVRLGLDAWEDDTGNRCTFDNSWFNSDDCRIQKVCTVPISTTHGSYSCGNTNHQMQMSWQIA